MGNQRKSAFSLQKQQSLRKEPNKLYCMVESVTHEGVE